MKFGLLTVSYAGLFYAGNPLSIEQQIMKAKELGFDGLSIETKRPIASPLDLSKDDRKRIRSLAKDQGIELCAVESMSNFTSDYMEERENNLAMMNYVLDLAHELDVSIVKVFAAWPGLVNDEELIASYRTYERGNYYKRLYPKDLRKWDRAVDGIREIARKAKDLGITLALQNHAPVITPGYEDVLSMMEELDCENVKLCLDVPLFYDRQNDEYIKEAVEKCKDHMILSHYGAWNFIENEDGSIIQEPSPSFGGKINYKAFIKELVAANYNGYFVSEYCLPAIKNHKISGVEEIDKATRITLKYMKQLVEQYAPSKMQKSMN
ncbi:MAG: sugar phosphate isomerase/epimerase family protein [Flavisolibacter sp.]